MPWITIDAGEYSYQVWEEDPKPTPVSAASDPELPQPDPPPPAPTATSTTASNNAATTGNGTSTPAGDQSGSTATTSTADITAQIRGELSGGPQNQGYLNLILNKYSAEDLARAYPEFGNAEDYRVAKNGLPKDLIVPGSLDAEGRQQFVQGTPEFIRAEQLSRQGGREAIRKAAIANGFPPDAAIPTTGDINGRVYITLENGKLIDITDYFEGNPKPPVAIPLNVATYGTSTVTTPFRQVEITALPAVSITVNTSEGAIVVDPNSETARFIQWQGSQPGLDGRPLRETWARQGISDPYSNPAIVGQAVKQIDRADARTELFNQSGVTPPAGQIAPWNDPKWPEYQGSNREAYASASAALADVDVKNQLKAENGWDEATFQSWALRATNPEEWGRQAAAYDAANGIVVGPSSGATTALSANGATVVTTTGQVDSQGFALSTYSTVNNAAGAVDAATGGLITTGAGAINTATNIVNTAIPVATAALAGFASASAAADAAQSLISGAVKSAVALPSSLSPFVTAATDAFSAAASTGLTTVENLFSGQAATLLLAKNQATLQARNNEAATADWRVRLQLGTQADYLYKDAEPGILAPLYDTDGVIFPYMPTIETSYAANYDKFDLTHSNYRGYFYKGSNVNDINLRATFTAQDTQEANYLLAVIHFFRSVTKMFYGQDAYRGAPPPLVFLNGLGNYQFNEHPCFVSNFSYSLPNDVDYIRAQAPNNYGNLFSKRERTGSTSGGLLGSVATRLLGLGVSTVNPSMPNVPSPGMIQSNVTNINDATYVPTKMEINITLLPTNTRAQVSQQFSLTEFANGNLLKGGFW
jgi:hypothetical protein